ncbi:MAG: hypothetical protein J0H98_05170 [Solirubrobacterales bacterium]|nr:hypothetical protein [Solirubrobacterales bacterium]
MPTTRIDLKRLLGAALTVSVLGLAAAGCGGGDDDPEPATTTATTGTTEPVAITKASLIEQGDAICAEVNAAVGSIQASTADETTKSSQMEDIYDGLAQRLGDLGTPSDGDPPTDVIAAVQDLANGSTDTTALQDAASEYGFTDCAEAPSSSSVPSSGSEDPSGSSTSEPTPTYTPPATTPEPTPTPTPTTPAPSTGGGVAPAPAPSTGGSGSSGGSPSGGISPG